MRWLFFVVSYVLVFYWGSKLQKEGYLDTPINLDRDPSGGDSDWDEEVCTHTWVYFGIMALNAENSKVSFPTNNRRMRHVCCKCNSEKWFDYFCK